MILRATICIYSLGVGILLALPAEGDLFSDTSCIYTVLQNPTSPCAGEEGVCPDCNGNLGTATYTEYSGAQTHTYSTQEGYSGGIQEGVVDCWRTITCTSSPRLFSTCPLAAFDPTVENARRECEFDGSEIACEESVANDPAWQVVEDYELWPCIAGEHDGHGVG